MPKPPNLKKMARIRPRKRQILKPKPTSLHRMKLPRVPSPRTALPQIPRRRIYQMMMGVSRRRKMRSLWRSLVQTSNQSPSPMIPNHPRMARANLKLTRHLKRRIRLSMTPPLQRKMQAITMTSLIKIQQEMMSCPRKKQEPILVPTRPRKLQQKEMKNRKPRMNRPTLLLLPPPMPRLPMKAKSKQPRGKIWTSTKASPLLTSLERRSIRPTMARPSMTSQMKAPPRTLKLPRTPRMQQMSIWKMLKIPLRTHLQPMRILQPMRRKKSL